MTLFIKIQPDDLTTKYLEDTDARLHDSNIVENPFVGYCKKLFKEGEGVIYAISMTPVYPPFWWGGIFTGIIMVLWKRVWWSWWYLPSCIMLLTYIMWTDLFPLWGVTKGLRKVAKYRGKVVKMQDKDVWNRIIDEKF